MNVRLLRPPRALFTTLTLEASNNAPKGLPQPMAPGMPFAAVESPAMKMDGACAAAAIPTKKKLVSLLTFLIEFQPKVIINHAARRRARRYNQFQHVRTGLHRRGVECHVPFTPYSGDCV